ncbi:MAG: hypothetical protein RL556_819 [Actinomycetota bacterium]|jgi:superfamily I DNA/RNA helicase/RecB family exonuclease
MTQAKFLSTPARQSRAFGLLPDLTSLNANSVACVFGVPGSGKTSQLRSLVSSWVATGIRPEAILVIAASRDSAAKLRESIVLDLQMTVEGSLARTVSSLAFAVVRQVALAAGERAPELISGSEQDAILAELLEPLSSGQVSAEGWPKHFDAKVFALAGFRAELRDLISVCQEHSITASNLADLGREHQRLDWIASSSIFAAYEEKLLLEEFANRFDAPTLLSAATHALADPQVNALTSKYATVLVDDAQELTPAAATFIEALVGLDRGLILFGDTDSSTLGFRSADPKLFENLANKVASARGAASQAISILELPINRANDVQKLMAAASTKIVDKSQAQKGHRRANFVPNLNADKNLNITVLNSAEAEVSWLARQLREAHLHGELAWQDLAVVARSRAQLEGLEMALAAESVPVRIVGAQAALRDEFGSRSILDVVELAFVEGDYSIEQVLTLLASPFCGLDSLGLRRLRRSLRAEAILNDSNANTNELLIELFQNSDSLTTIGSNEAKVVRRFLKRFEITRRLALDSSTSIEDLLWQLWDESLPCKDWPTEARGLGEVAVQANRNLDSVLALFAAANRYVERDPGAKAYDFIRIQLDQELPEDSLAISKRGVATVDLLTPAGLIGRRYELVAVPQLIEGVFPNLRPRSSLLGANVLSALKFGRIASVSEPVRTEFADEMRMLYKAVGASNSKVLLSAAQSQDDQLSQFLHLASGNQMPQASAYVTEALTLRSMAGKLRRDLAVAQDAQAQVQISAALGVLAAEGTPGAHPDSWYGLLPISSEEPLFELSATAGDEQNQKVVISPSQLQAWADCPLHWFISSHGGKSQDFSASLGSIVHKALELTKSKSEEELWSVVQSKWHTLEFESAWQERAAERKARKLIQNITSYLATFQGEVATVEQKFVFELGDARVMGTVDRIELTPEGRVVIVDLKTGKKKPSKEELQDHAQLGVYQLAFEAGAFSGVEGLDGLELEGAKLLIVGNEKPEPQTQASIEVSGKKQFFEELLAGAASGMAMPEKYFVAKVASHCQTDHNYASCSLHLIQAVSYAG